VADFLFSKQKTKSRISTNCAAAALFFILRRKTIYAEFLPVHKSFVKAY
jgi:hypothetical protein